MKKLFTIGFVASFFAVSMVACTKNESVNPTSNSSSTLIKKNITPSAQSLNALSPLAKKDTVTPPRLIIAIRDTVTPPRILLKRDTVTPPHIIIAIRDTVTPPKK